MIVYGILLSAFIITWALTYLLMRPEGPIQILDHPNDRSLHSAPMARTGGLAIWAGSVVGMISAEFLMGWNSNLAWIASAALIVGIVSFLDDRSHLPAGIRLVVHMAAAGLLLAGGIGLRSINLPGMNFELILSSGLLLSGFFVIWMTNLYNFMDGIDGFAGGMAVLGFGTLGLLGMMAGDDHYAVLCWVIAAAAAGFLTWNFPPARIFMGDAGSSALGLMAAALSLWADREGLFPLWISILIFSPFIIDATVTLLRRTIKGERVWEAHRNHYYQRLVQAGWSHRRAVLWEYGLMLFCSTGALCAYRASTTRQWVILGIILCASMVGIMGVRHIEQRRTARRTPEVSL